MEIIEHQKEAPSVAISMSIGLFSMYSGKCVKSQGTHDEVLVLQRFHSPCPLLRVRETLLQLQLSKTARGMVLYDALQSYN